MDNFKSENIIGLCVFKITFDLVSTEDRSLKECIEIDSYIQKDEDLFYCYAPEIGEMAYGSSSQNATERMLDVITDLLQKGGSDSSMLKDIILDTAEPIENMYIINYLHRHFKRETLDKSDAFSKSGYNDDILMQEVTKETTCTMKLRIGTIKISAQIQLAQVS